MPKKDVEKELEKYRKLIDQNYIEDESDNLDQDILGFCLKKKLNKDISIYGKMRSSFFDDKSEQIKKKRKNDKF